MSDISAPTHPPSSSARGRSTAGARRWSPCIFSASTRGVRARRGGAAARAPQRRGAPRRGPRRRAFCRRPRDGERIVTGGDDGKVVATDATARASRHRNRRQAPLDRSRRARARRRGGLVGRQAGIRARPARARAQRSKCRRPSAGWRSRRRAFGSRSRTTTARRSGFRTRRPRPRCSSGRARISASPSARTGASWSPRCRSRRCTAGASSTARTCACRAIGARALARLDRRRQVARDLGLDAAHPVAVPGKDGPMGKTPQYGADRGARRSRRLPSQAGDRRGRLRRRTRAARAHSTTAPRSWPRSRATRRSRRWPGAQTASLLAFGTEDGEAGVIDLR